MQRGLNFINYENGIIGNVLESSEQIEGCVFPSALVELRHLSPFLLQQSHLSVWINIRSGKSSLLI